MPDSAAFSAVDADGNGDESRGSSGVFAVYAPGKAVLNLTYNGLYALRHRGGDAVSVAVSDGRNVTVLDATVPKPTVADEFGARPLRGALAVGEIATLNKRSGPRGANPLVVRSGPHGSGFVLCHDGGLTNIAALAELVSKNAETDADFIAGMLAGYASDSSSEDYLVDALNAVLPELDGAYSLVVMDARRVIGVRDPNGFRPLCLGRLEKGWVLASESPAFDSIGAHFVREIEPGEMVVIEASGVSSFRSFAADRIDPKLCLMEHIYLSRPDTRLYGREIHGVRRRMGELLAEQAPMPSSDRFFDRPAMVMGVPETGEAAAEGFALRSGFRLGQGLLKTGVPGRFSPLHENVANKRLVVVDDAIVHGAKTRIVTNVLRAAGAVEVHLRVSSPPHKWPCFYGVDTGTGSELLAANLDLEDMRQYLGVDSIGFLSLPNLKSAVGVPGAGFCDACFTGNYPTSVPVEFAKKNDHQSGETIRL